jgi:hypothetical protein
MGFGCQVPQWVGSRDNTPSPGQFRFQAESGHAIKTPSAELGCRKVAVAESSNGKYWFDVREVNLNRINSKSLLLVRIVPDLFILETLQTVSPLLSKQVMDNRPHSGNVWGIHIDIKKSTNSAFLFNIKNPSNKIATKLLKKTEINHAFDSIK